jgi:hypothetical protein
MMFMVLTTQLINIRVSWVMILYRDMLWLMLVADSLPLQRSGFKYMPGLVGFVVEKATLQQGFFKCFSLPLSVPFTTAPYLYIHH